MMQAIGNGIIAPGQVSVTIGTGAQVFAPIASAIYDKQLRAHTFNNFQQDSWYFMGATLCGGLSLRWLRDTVLGGMPYREMDTQVEAVPRGSDGLIYLPYLSGERTPHMDPLARGMFFGLTLKHSRAHLMRAVMEGVVFSPVSYTHLDVYKRQAPKSAAYVPQQIPFVSAPPKRTLLHRQNEPFFLLYCAHDKAASVFRPGLFSVRRPLAGAMRTAAPGPAHFARILICKAHLMAADR